MHRRVLETALLGTAAALFVACATEPAPASYRSALTGEECSPDPGTLMAPLRGGHRGRGGSRSPTGIPGDNLDDPHSGRIDCLGDGNSGQGDDRRGCYPQPGCDADGCCEVIPEPVLDAGTPEPDPEPTPDPEPAPEQDAGVYLI